MGVRERDVRLVRASRLGVEPRDGERLGLVLHREVRHGEMVQCPLVLGVRLQYRCQIGDRVVVPTGVEAEVPQVVDHLLVVGVHALHVLELEDRRVVSLVEHRLVGAEQETKPFGQPVDESYRLRDLGSLDRLVLVYPPKRISEAIMREGKGGIDVDCFFKRLGRFGEPEMPQVFLAGEVLLERVEVRRRHLADVSVRHGDRRGRLVESPSRALGDPVDHRGYAWICPCRFRARRRDDSSEFMSYAATSIVYTSSNLRIEATTSTLMFACRQISRPSDSSIPPVVSLPIVLEDVEHPRAGENGQHAGLLERCDEHSG